MKAPNRQYGFRVSISREDVALSGGASLYLGSASYEAKMIIAWSISPLDNIYSQQHLAYIGQLLYLIIYLSIKNPYIGL